MESAIKVTGLTKFFPRCKAAAVDCVSFEVKKGALFCLLGVNGAGKSTVLNTLCTLLSMDSGGAVIAGSTLGKDNNIIRSKIGVVFQDSRLDDRLSVLENLWIRGCFYKISEQKLKQRIDILTSKLGLDKVLRQRYSTLSGGTRRRCDIARALLHSPQILFLDEPTMGLDPQNRGEMWELINQLRKQENLTIFLTTHYMEETERADCICIMEGGKIICTDTPQNLRVNYAHNILRLTAKPTMELQLAKLLTAYTRQGDKFVVRQKSSTETIGLLNSIEWCIESFELQKADMSKIFLDIVGGDNLWHVSKG